MTSELTISDIYVLICYFVIKLVYGFRVKNVFIPEIHYFSAQNYKKRTFFAFFCPKIWRRANVRRTFALAFEKQADDALFVFYVRSAHSRAPLTPRTVHWTLLGAA